MIAKNNLDKLFDLLGFAKAGQRKPLQAGDQLFSYAQQISEPRFLCRYTFGLEDGALTYASHIVAHRDNGKYLDDSPGLKGFKTAARTPERFAIWRDTYKLDYTTIAAAEVLIASAPARKQAILQSYL